MKLTSVKVQNYKSIDDSTAFEIDEVTCLLGKNEAGKSAILEALYKLKPFEGDHDEQFTELDYPRRHISTYRERAEKTPDNVLTTIWQLEPTDIAAVNKSLGTDAFKSSSITITKGYSNQTLYSNVIVDDQKIVDSLIAGGPLSQQEVGELNAPKNVDELRVALGRPDPASDNQTALLDSITKRFPKSAVSTAIHTLHNLLPTLVYFSDYDRLAGRVAVKEVVAKLAANGELDMGHRIFLALLGLANSSLEDIQDIKKLDYLKMELEAIENRLTDEIFEYWTQNKYLEVDFAFDMARDDDPPPYNSGYIFTTRIKNTRHRAAVNFDDRSTGFIWFFSFLIWFSQAKKNFGENLVILLDEPGLTLHGKAQRDLLRYFNEKLRPHYQVIYTTHSPFMIDMENVFSVRTVEDRVELIEVDGHIEEEILGTKVGKNVLARDADSIMPLQGLVGFDLAQTCFVGPYVLVVEGPTEAGYINWFSRHLIRKGREGLDLRWAVCPAEGATKVSSFVTLFSGRGLKIAALMDYHDPQKKLVDQLEASKLLQEEHLFKTTDIVGQPDADIEDLVGRELYIHLINECLRIPFENRLPAKKPAGAEGRTVKEVENHCRTLPPGCPEFGHFTAVDYLLGLTDAEVDTLPGLDKALGNFQKLFSQLNSLLGKHPTAATKRTTRVPAPKGARRSRAAAEKMP